MTSALSKVIQQQHAPQRYNGVIKWFKADLGYGFATVNGGADIFLHARELHDSGIFPSFVSPGDAVTFTLGTSKDGRTFAREIVMPKKAA